MTRKTLAFLTACLLLPAACFPAAAEKPVPTEGIVIPDFTQQPLETHPYTQITPSIEFVRNLGAGWNLGNAFDAYEDNPEARVEDLETYWSHAKTSRELIHTIADAGFNLIRIPVSWHNHVTDGDYTIDPAWMERVKEVVGWALEEDMYVIINIHHDNNTDFLYPDSAHYEQSEKYVTAVWRQIAEAFKEYNEHVIFEGLNEPRLAGTEYEWVASPEIPEVLDAMQCINRLNLKFVETVRAGGECNEWRFLMITGYDGGAGGILTDSFELPMDDRLILEMHLYEPGGFALMKDDPDTSFDLEKEPEKTQLIRTLMEDLFNRHIRYGVPVIIDEFGALYKTDEALQDRVNFAAYVTATAAAWGIPVAWWDNANYYEAKWEQFAIIDRNTAEWLCPDIALAILINSKISNDK